MVSVASRAIMALDCIQYLFINSSTFSVIFKILSKSELGSICLKKG